MAAKQGLRPAYCGLSLRLCASLPLMPRRPWKCWIGPIQHLLVATSASSKCITELKYVIKFTASAKFAMLSKPNATATEIQK
uniref:Uncharacterized protein n=1 Tax=Cucumis melo TaxID=3656 RepID=A0A9I9EF66_CUCME